MKRLLIVGAFISTLSADLYTDDGEPLIPKFSDPVKEFTWLSHGGADSSYVACMKLYYSDYDCAPKFPLEFANIKQQNMYKAIISHNQFPCGNGSKSACDAMIEANKKLKELIKEYKHVKGK